MNSYNEISVKFIIFICCFLLYPLQNIGQTDKKITAVVTNNSKGRLTLYFNDKYNHDRFFYVKNDSNSIYTNDTIVINTNDPIQLRFPKGFQQNPIFLFPDDTIYVSFSNKKIINYTFTGKHTQEFNFLTFLENNNIGVSYLDLTTLSWNDKINVEAILEEHNRLYNLRMNILDKHGDSLFFEPKYRQVFRNEIELVHLLGYMQPFFNIRDKEKLPDTYFNKLDSYKKWLSTDTTLTGCFFYRFAIMCYDMYLNRNSAEKNFFKRNYFSAKVNYTEPVRYFVQFHLLHNQEDKSSTLFQECLNDFKKTCPIKDYINHLEQEIVGAKLAADSLVYDNLFLSQKLIDINGNNTTWESILKQNKGQVTYADMWASWCGPCRMEMPNSIKLQNELSKDKLSFVYISIDNDKAKWIKAITATRLNDKGKQHYLLDPDSKLAKFLTPNGIPKYFIINKEGAVEHLEAPRPSDPKTKEILTDLVQK